MRRSEFKTLVTIGIIGAILAASIYGGYIDFTPSTISAGDDDDELDTTTTVVVENPYDLPDGMSIDSASYIIYKNGTLTCAKNGTTGYTEFCGTDAGDLIQETIDNLAITGGTILIKSGTYTIDDTLDVNSSGIWIQGESSTSTIIEDTREGDETSIIFNAFDTITSLHVTAENVKIRSLGFVTDSPGIIAVRNDGDNTTVEYCNFVSQFVGIYTGSSASNAKCAFNSFTSPSGSMQVIARGPNPTIANNQFNNCKAQAIFINDSASGAIITGNQIVDCVNNAIWQGAISVWAHYKSLSHVTVSNNIIIFTVAPSNSCSGILFDSEFNKNYTLSDCTISGNQVDARAYLVGLEGMYVHGKYEGTTDKNANVQRLTISGNSFSGTEHGLKMTMVANSTIIANNFYNNANASIYVSSWDNSIIDNKIDTAGYGIFLTASNNTIVERNYLYNCTTPIRNYDLGNVIRNNIGYRTEMYGVAVILSGTSQISVPLDMDVNPNVVTLGCSYPNVTLWWDISGSNLLIRSTSAVTANVTVSYCAYYVRVA